MDARERMILALDMDSAEEAERIVNEFKDDVGMFKVGKQLFTHSGPGIVQFIHERGGSVFLDLKYHDIPNTVSKAAVEATRLGVRLFNVHASGGFTMMKETRKAVDEAAARFGKERPIVVAVTVLTSIDDDELHRMGFGITARELTERLALLTREAGLDGVVASGHELETIRRLCGREFLVVTPGVRTTDKRDDQKRTVGPYEAIRKGATYLVLGRTVLGTANPKETLRRIEGQIRDAISDEQR